MYGFILAALPLRPGLSGSFNAVEEYDDKLSVETFRVLGQERIKAGHLGPVLAWRGAPKSIGKASTGWCSG